jgi:hypothetical protein
MQAHLDMRVCAFLVLVPAKNCGPVSIHQELRSFTIFKLIRYECHHSVTKFRVGFGIMDGDAC